MAPITEPQNRNRPDGAVCASRQALGEVAGLPQQAARVLASKFEETAALAKKSAEDGIAGRFDKVEAHFEKLEAHIDVRLAEMRAEIAQVRTDMQQSFRSSQTATFTAIGLATGFLAVLFAALTFI